MDMNIALTGSRYSGKNGVAKLFRQIGIPVFDADAVVKYLLNYDQDIADSVLKKFGKEYVFDSYINPLAFDTDEKMSCLIDLVEFELFESYQKFRAKNSGQIYTIFHSSIIFEKDWWQKFDKIICVFSPQDVRIDRYIQDNGDKYEVAWNLFDKEMNDNRKNQISNFVIHNYPQAPDILKQIEQIDTEIVDEYLKKKQIELEYDLKNLKKWSEEDKASKYKNIYTL